MVRDQLDKAAQAANAGHSLAWATWTSTQKLEKDVAALQTEAEKAKEASAAVVGAAVSEIVQGTP